ncbi:metallophosphoesterase family protein [Sphingomonas sp.]|uniref:metallophosphoesterase family protein n=1 Tax=Sphingomonas sp. TaxID=28214 RepID=UPI003B00A9E9
MRAPPRIARHERIYAIGDVHGCLDLLVTLLTRIRADAERRPAQRTRILFIGDLIDRGPCSREVVEWLHDNTGRDGDVIVLRGNHEQMMIQALDGDEPSFEAWLRFGGEQTLRSWGFQDNDFALELADIVAAARRAVPPSVTAWLAALPFSYRSGDFYFVHAGIRPGTSLARQHPDDLLWIGEEFLSAEVEHEAVIVHGHSVREHGPEMLRHRINLDTGAYRTGRLTAVGFEGSRQWSISATSERGVDVPAPLETEPC